jgi:hypothetical protein
MYDGDLEEHAGQGGVPWNQTVAVFLGLAAMLGMGYSAAALWYEIRLPNGRELWHGLAISSVLLSASAVSMWRRSIILAVVLLLADVIFIGFWMPDR